jgi:hypothetical protein
MAPCVDQDAAVCERRERERETVQDGPRKDVRRSSGWKKKEDEELR